MIKTVALVSLSAGTIGEDFVKHEVNIGLKRLEQFGLNVKIMPHAMKGIEYVKNHPKERANDLLAAICDEEVDMILCAIGGDDTYRLLPYLFKNNELKEAIEKAVKAIDECVKDTVEAAKANDYEVIIIADHGNADHALNEDGTPNTAHSLNPVPFVYVTENKNAKVENGVLADVAPSILHILGMPQPADMTGRDLIK